MTISPSDIARDTGQRETNGRLPTPPPPTPTAQYPQGKKRYRRILFFFGRIIAHLIIWDIIGGRIPLLRNWTRHTRPDRFRQWASRFRALAVDMGGVLIKLGQFLSARVDVLPPEVTDELQGLQDEVPPEPSEHIFAILQADLGDLTSRFAQVQTEPVAAASLGQAHRAWLLPTADDPKPSQSVIIKVQRPHIENIVQVDLDALRLVARWVMYYQPIRRRADVPALMEEFAHTLWQELDYEAEADNAERLAAIFANNDRVYIPAVYRQHSTRRVIVLEDVESIKITDLEAMQATGIDPTEVADCLFDAYFHQIFRERFFHADPHPGNLFVRPRADLPWNPDEGGRPFWLIFIDFGMVGHVPGLVSENLSKVLISVTQRDARQLTEAYNDLGFFLPGTDLERIIEAQDVILNRIWGRKLLELSRPDLQELEEIGQQFRDILFDFPFQIPQDFIYLGRTIGMMSGLVSQLNPEINPWYKIEQYGQEMVQEQLFGQDLSLEKAVEFLKPYLATPARVQRLLDAAENGRLRVQTKADRETIYQLKRLEKRLSQLSWTVLGAAGMLSAVLLWRKKSEDD